MDASAPPDEAVGPDPDLEPAVRLGTMRLPPLPPVPRNAAMLSYPSPGRHNMLSYLALTRLVSDPANETETDQELYHKLGIERNWRLNEAERAFAEENTTVLKLTSFVPFKRFSVVVPFDAIQQLMVGDSERVKANCKHPLYRAIVKHLTGHTRYTMSAQKRAPIYGVTVRAVMHALGLSANQSTGRIVETIAKMMGGLPTDLVVMKRTGANVRSGTRVVDRIMPSWVIPFIIPCLPGALKDAQRPTLLVCSRVLRDLERELESKSGKAGHPLSAEILLLETAFECYSMTTECVILNNEAMKNALGVFLTDISDRMELIMGAQQTLEERIDQIRIAQALGDKRLAKLETGQRNLETITAVAHQTTERLESGHAELARAVVQLSTRLAQAVVQLSARLDRKRHPPPPAAARDSAPYPAPKRPRPMAIEQ